MNRPTTRPTDFPLMQWVGNWNQGSRPAHMPAIAHPRGFMSDRLHLISRNGMSAEDGFEQWVFCIESMTPYLVCACGACLDLRATSPLADLGHLLFKPGPTGRSWFVGDIGWAASADAAACHTCRGVPENPFYKQVTWVSSAEVAP